MYTLIQSDTPTVFLSSFANTRIQNFQYKKEFTYKITIKKQKQKTELAKTTTCALPLKMLRKKEKEQKGWDTGLGIHNKSSLIVIRIQFSVHTSKPCNSFETPTGEITIFLQHSAVSPEFLPNSIFLALLEKQNTICV